MSSSVIADFKGAHTGGEEKNMTDEHKSQEKIPKVNERCEKQRDAFRIMIIRNK